MSAHRLRIVVASRAQSDLRLILAYTGQQWGSAQRRIYRKQISEAFVRVANFPKLGESRPNFGPAIRGHRVGQHVDIHETSAIELRIVRILHVNRDLDAALS